MKTLAVVLVAFGLGYTTAALIRRWMRALQWVRQWTFQMREVRDE